MNALVAAVLLLGAAVGAAPASASVPQQTRDKVEAYLGTLDTPIPASQWKALGESGVTVLDEIARSSSALPTRRARAVAAAGLIGGPTAQRLAQELATAQTAPAVVRAAAATAVAHVLPAAQATPTLEKVLASDPSLTVRRAAAEAVVQVAPERCGALRETVQRESSSHRPAFSHALEKCRAPNAKK